MSAACLPTTAGIASQHVCASAIKASSYLSHGSDLGLAEAVAAVPAAPLGIAPPRGPACCMEAMQSCTFGPRACWRNGR